jgi:hypothetical protein
MSTTLSTMRSRIADDLNRSDLSTQIDKAINRAITFYEKEHFWFNESVDTFATVASQSSYGTSDGVASDIAEIIYMEIAIGTQNWSLNPKSYHYIRGMIGMGYAGDPYNYAINQQKIWVYPIPSQVRTITITYQSRQAELTSDSDTNNFLTYAEDLIESRARGWLYGHVIKDQSLANISYQEEKEALDALRTKTGKLLSTGFIEPTQF